MPRPKIPGTRAAPRSSSHTRTKRKYATIIDLSGDKKPGSPVRGDAGHGDRGRARLPIQDAAHARNALARLPLAKGLDRTQKKVVAQRAANVLGHVTPGAEKYGVSRLTRTKAAALRQAPIVKGRTRSRRSGFAR